MTRKPNQRGQKLDALKRLEELRTVMEETTQVELQMVKAKRRYKQAVVAAVESAGAVRTMEVLGVSRGRVYQILAEAKGAQ